MPGFDYFIRNYLVMPSFIRLETHLAQKDITRCLEAIEGEESHLGKLVTDWAVWDDTYEFANDWGSDYQESNLQPEALANVGIHVVFFITNEGEVKISKSIDDIRKTVLSEQAMPARIYSQDHPLVRTGYRKAEKFAGIVITQYGPLLVAASKILPSGGSGSARGTLVMGRFLNQSVINSLNRQTQITFIVKTEKSHELGEAERQLLASQGPRMVFDDRNSDGFLHGYTSVNDIYGNPALIIDAALPREIFLRGLETARLISLTMLVSTLIIGFCCIVLFIFYRKKVHAHRSRIEALVEERTTELTASDARYKALAEVASEGIAILEEGICTDLNRRAQEMFGFEEGEFLGRMTTELIAPAERDFVRSKISLEYGSPYETSGLRKDGTIFPLLIQGKSISFEKRTIRAAILNDLTEKKKEEIEKRKLEKRLERSEKMESIGLMAGGVAHDLNNILSGVVTFPELILMNLPQESSIRRPLEEIQKAGRRAAEVVADLLTVARGIAMVMEPLNLNTIVRDYLESPECAMLKKYHFNVEINANLEQNLPLVLGSTVHISKSLMNLVTNGAEAINGLGVITIKTSCESLGEVQAVPLGICAGKYVILSVYDDGPGISPEDQLHIFEPFYTRKITARSGTGLGLAVVWNTMQDHKGIVHVSSSSAGSVFRLYFPETDQSLPQHEQQAALPTLKGNSETILVVDDDGQQLLIAEQLLNALNYSPRTVKSGQAALAVLQDQPAALVILDMLMNTGMNGLETYQAILNQHPGQKAIIASGFSESIDVQKAKELGASAFVKKPYSIGVMGEAIKKALAE